MLKNNDLFRENKEYFKNDANSMTNLELTKRVFKLWINCKDKEIKDELFLLIKSSAKYEWGKDTECLIEQNKIIIDNSFMCGANAVTELK